MGIIQTVRGPIAPEAFGLALVHEHVMCDFIGAEETGPHRWDRDEVVETMRPHLSALHEQGVRALVDCSPMYLGRDPSVLSRLSARTGLHLVTNTGLYKEPYVPAWAFGLRPEALAERWIAEWEEGIEGTGIRPGFVKIAVNPGPLLPIQQTIVRAAAITHRATGLAVACHTGHAEAANQCLDLARARGMDPGGWIVVHAQNIGSMEAHYALARRGAWLEYDGLSAETLDRHAELVVAMIAQGYEDQILLSQDAGWYRVGEPGGGQVRPYTALLDLLVPRLVACGVGYDTIHRLLVVNPSRALQVG